MTEQPGKLMQCAFTQNTYTARRNGLWNQFDACKNEIGHMEMRLAMNWAWRPTWEADHGASWKNGVGRQTTVTCPKRGAGNCPVTTFYYSPFFNLPLPRPHLISAKQLRNEFKR